MNKYYLVGVTVTYLIISSLGYVFHDILMHDWLHEKESAIIREEYILPGIAIAFFFYTIIQAFLLHVFYFYAKSKHNWSIYKTALIFGALIGFLWDALQGGIIEYATFKMPIEVVFVDSTFHVIEGAYTAMILAFFYNKFIIQKNETII